MSVNQTENKRKGIHQIGYCLKYLMTFLSPYKGGLILGLLMVVVANITFAVMPLVEGQMTKINVRIAASTLCSVSCSALLRVSTSLA